MMQTGANRTTMEAPFIHRQRAIGIWLLAGYVMVLVMVVLGGITRLTQSGLSIVEWNVIMGILPPLNEETWQTAFDQYKQFPQFKILNAQMSLEAFKSIFFWEYVHRLWGRLIGLVFLIPFMIFHIRKQLTPMVRRRSMIAFLLGGIQGAMGWYMVKSGLIDVPHVSHFRLTVHLMLALAISGILLWTALQVWKPAVRRERNANDRLVAWALGFVILQIAIGGLVAGLKAGYMYNTFPWMGDAWLPDSAWMMPDPLQNVLENGVMVQFMHRWMAWVAAGAVIFAWISARRHPNNAPLRRILFLAVVAVAVQIAVGILTLLYAVPVVLGVLHQAAAFLVFSLLMVGWYFARYDVEKA